MQHLVEAAALLRRHAPAARVLIVGDGEERATLERQAAALGLDDMVLFVGMRTDVPALLAAADVYVQPSLFEAFPVSVLEAMAVGLPVVATAVGGVPEMVAHGKSGLLVPPARPDALAAAMVQLLDSATRTAMGASGRAWVEQHASTDVWLDQLQRGYARALRARV
jgi:glycosyltransferase involved in cell wall biosynthesis